MTETLQSDWPDDADGDVLRRMQSSGFDFTRAVDIDFNVDFGSWPVSEEFIDILRTQYSQVKVYPPDSTGSGYVQLVVHAMLTYQLVMSIQNSVSELASPFGGICESWGVWH